jgi:hypothetical protein
LKQLPAIAQVRQDDLWHALNLPQAGNALQSTMLDKTGITLCFVAVITVSSSLVAPPVLEA